MTPKEKMLFQARELNRVCANYRGTFGLSGFPGKTFRINERACYWSGDTLMLYTAVKDGNNWNDFAKCTEEELRANMVGFKKE